MKVGAESKGSDTARVREMNRSLINANDPFRMGTYAKAHM